MPLLPVRSAAQPAVQPGPHLMVDRLNQRFRLGLELIPQHRLAVSERITAAAANNQHFLPRLQQGLESGLVEQVDQALSGAGLQLFKTGNNYRLNFVEKKGLLGRTIDRFHHLFDPIGVTDTGQLTWVGQEKRLVSDVAFSQGGGHRLPNPTAEEYQDNDLMRQAIEAGKKQFLKDPKLGWAAENINVNNFHRASYTFRDATGVEKGFTGQILPRKRGFGVKKTDLVALLREIGIKVKGEAVGHANPTEEEYQDNDLMKQAIEAGKELFLQDPELGWVANNIQSDQFIISTYSFIDAAGVEKGFIGKTLLSNRGLEKNKTGVGMLLQEIGIKVKGEVVRRANPTEEEYQDDDLMRRAIEAGKEQFLKHPELGWVAENIRPDRFIDSLYNFVDASGTRKMFSGKPLLKRRGLEKNATGVVALLRELGIRVEGEIVRYANPTEEEYQDDDLIRKAIEASKEQFLKDPELGLAADNIHVNNFAYGLYTFVDAAGTKKGFKGQTLLIKRGLEKTKTVIVALLREIGIEVEGDVAVLPHPTAKEYMDNDLMRQIIEAGKEQFLKDPELGWTTENIQPDKFCNAQYAFVDTSGVKKGFTGQTLLIKRGLEKNITGVGALFKELGVKVYESNVDSLLDKYQLYDEVASLGDDPAVLYRYLLLTQTGLTEEAIRQIVISSFKGVKENNRLDMAELHASYRVVPGQVSGPDLPAGTAETYLEVSGQVGGPFEAVQVVGDTTKKIAVEKDGSFKGRIRLKVGQENRLELYGLNDTDRTKSAAVEFKMQQTGQAGDPEEMLLEFIDKVAGLADQLLADPKRLAYLTKTIERGLVRHFMESEEEGFAYLEKKRANCRSPLFQRVYEEVQIKFTKISALEIPDFRPDRALYFFQKYCLYEIRQAMSNGNGVNGIVLANEQGLGKTVVVLAALAAMRKPGLVITPNAVVSTWGEQQGYFFESGEPLSIVKGGAVARSRQMNQHASRTRVTNIEYLRGEGGDRFAAMNRSGKEQVLVFDESQFLSSTSSQQSAGARRLQGGFKILVSATPFAGINTARPILEFLEGGQYGNARMFGSKFNLNDPESVRLLHLMLDRYLIRFRKKDVFKEYDPARPLAEQSNRLPAKAFVPPAELGEYELTEKQCEAVLEIFLRWEDWQARLKGRPLTYEDQLTLKRTKNFFSRRESLRQSMNDPLYGRVSREESPKHAKMDEIVDLEAGERKGKLLIFCRYRAEVEEYARRYKGFGYKTMTYYGGTSEVGGKKQEYLKDKKGKVRTFRLAAENEYAIGTDGKLIEDPKGATISPLDYSRLMFQNDPETRILVSSYDSGAVGVTFTAADAVTFSDLARDYVTRYQAEDRANRIDNERPKYQVRYYQLVAKYPQSFMEKMKGYAAVKIKGTSIVTLKQLSEITPAMREDPELVIENVYETYLVQGTYDEVHGRYLEAQRRIFELIIDGLQSEQEQAAATQSVLSRQMPFLFANGKTSEEISRDEADLAEQIENERVDDNGQD